MTIARAESEIVSIRGFFRLLPYTLEVFENWQRIVIAQGVSGKQTHDAHLVAVMESYAVTSILTFNGSDFGRFPGITVLEPAQL